jgi:hypothetical protein
MRQGRTRLEGLFYFGHSLFRFTIAGEINEGEATRCMTWTLIHNPDARAMLSELTRGRDAFVAEEEPREKTL